jgi:hypothetical protein
VVLGPVPRRVVAHGNEAVRFVADAGDDERGDVYPRLGGLGGVLDDLAAPVVVETLAARLGERGADGV